MHIVAKVFTNLFSLATIAVTISAQRKDTPMYHIIINPASRSGEGLKIWKEQIEPALLRDQIPFQAYFSAKSGDVTRIAAEITGKKTSPLCLIILGGDGTMNEALQGIQNLSALTLGYIPTGSSNDLARDLKLPLTPTAALDLILHSGRAVRMDLGTVTYPDGQNRRFAVSCGIGFDAAVCEEALHSRIKKVLNRIGLGKLTYLGIALKQLITSKPTAAKLILDDKPPIPFQNMLFIACMLHRFEGGGFMFCPDADACDGVLDLCTAGDITLPRILRALPTAFKGQHFRFRGITPYRAERVTVELSAPLWLHTDGEVTRRTDRFTVSCEPNALCIIVPAFQ